MAHDIIEILDQFVASVAFVYIYMHQENHTKTHIIIKHSNKWSLKLIMDSDTQNHHIMT